MFPPSVWLSDSLEAFFHVKEIFRDSGAYIVFFICLHWISFVCLGRKLRLLLLMRMNGGLQVTPLRRVIVYSTSMTKQQNSLKYPWEIYFTFWVTTMRFYKIQKRSTTPQELYNFFGTRVLTPTLLFSCLRDLAQPRYRSFFFRGGCF